MFIAGFLTNRGFLSSLPYARSDHDPRESIHTAAVCSYLVFAQVLDQFQEQLEAQHPDHKQYHSVFATVEVFGKHFPKHNLKVCMPNKKPVGIDDQQIKVPPDEVLFISSALLKITAPLVYCGKAIHRSWCC
jgi:hypothetical protein